MAGEPLKLLVLEDNAAVQDVLSNHLSMFGFEVTVAKNAVEALDYVANNHIDFIVSDLFLPGMNGFEFCKKMREDLSTCSIPIMIITGHNDPGNKAKAYQAGAQFFMEKPISSRYIADIVFAFHGLEPNNHQPKTLEELDKKQSEFISVVSHELRTPMTSIKSAVGLISDGTLGPLNDEQKEFFKLLDRNVHRLTKLINEILNFSRIESGRVRLNITDTNVVSLIQNVIRDFESSGEEVPSKIECDTSHEDIKTRVDSGKIERVIYYLLDNATSHNPDGTQITVGAVRNGQNVRVFVKDNGQGITEQEQLKIFNRFHQSDRKVGDGSQGMGLGLAICKGLVEAHGSQLLIESSVGKGAEFFFDLELSQ